jgi:hypothetical protein
VRNVVAFLFHAPGLWIFFRARLSPATVRANVVAVGFTLAAIAIAGAAAKDGGRIAAVLTAWAIGHVLWGFELVRRIRLPGGLAG